jgi:hypothetical protein
MGKVSNIEQRNTQTNRADLIKGESCSKMFPKMKDLN